LSGQNSRYDPDRGSFQGLDKFAVIADIDRLEAGKFNKMGIIYLP
jgi:hypothetical protein